MNKKNIAAIVATGIATALLSLGTIIGATSIGGNLTDDAFGMSWWGGIGVSLGFIAVLIGAWYGANKKTGNGWGFGLVLLVLVFAVTSVALLLENNVSSDMWFGVLSGAIYMLSLVAVATYGVIVGRKAFKMGVASCATS